MIEIKRLTKKRILPLFDEELYEWKSDDVIIMVTKADGSKPDGTTAFSYFAGKGYGSPNFLGFIPLLEKTYYVFLALPKDILEVGIYKMTKIRTRYNKDAGEDKYIAVELELKYHFRENIWLAGEPPKKFKEAIYCLSQLIHSKNNYACYINY